MALINKVILTGYVGSGMKVKAGGDGTGYTHFRLLVSDQRKPSPSRFFHIFMNEKIRVNFREGDYVWIEGELRSKVTDKHGYPVTAYYVDCRRAINLGIKINDEL